MTRKKLLVTASVVALGFAVASTASANPKNKFSDGGVAQVNVTTTITTGGGNSRLEIENGNVEKEVLATNNLNATFTSGEVYTGYGAAAADASAKASADASAQASADASAAAAASSEASAAATAAASSNTIVTGTGTVGTNAQDGDQAASSAAAAAAGQNAAAAATAAAAANAAADAAADASASADADAARAGDLLNARVALEGAAMLRAAGAFAANMGAGQFTNLNAGNAIAAKTGNIRFNQ